MSIFNAKEFAKALESQLVNRAIGTKPSDIVEDSFKAAVAKLLECYLEQYERQSIEMGFLENMMAELINCFREADLGNAQLSVEQYDALYMQTIQEIGNGANSEADVINTTTSNGYRMSKGGLYVPGYRA